MKLVPLVALLFLVGAPIYSQSLDCIGDHHEGCPVLVVSEELVAVPKCQQPQEVGHGTSSSLIRGKLYRRDEDGRQPATIVEVMRECLNEEKEVVRSCPMSLSLEPDGRFSQSIWRKSVGEAICRDGVLAKRDYVESIQLRLKSPGCRDLIVPLVWPWKDKSLVIDCESTER